MGSIRDRMKSDNRKIGLSDMVLFLESFNARPFCKPRILKVFGYAVRQEKCWREIQSGLAHCDARGSIVCRYFIVVRGWLQEGFDSRMQ